MTPDEQRKLDEEVNRGDRAEAILNDPLVIAALEATKDYAHQRWYGSESAADAYEARLYLKAADLFIKDFKTHIGSGKMARRSLLDMVNAAARKVSRHYPFRSVA